MLHNEEFHNIFTCHTPFVEESVPAIFGSVLLYAILRKFWLLSNAITRHSNILAKRKDA
jgi:hypothetical protein